MTIKQRDDSLRRIAQSDLGVALESYLKELIRELKDASTYPHDDFEITGKAALMAAAKLEKLIFKLNSLKTLQPPKVPNQYE